MPRNRAVAILIKDNKLLATKRNNHGHHYYALLGGGIEPGETPAQAVVREIKEEAMFDCKLERQLYEHHLDNGDKHYFFLCSIQKFDEPQMDPTSPEVLHADPDDTIEPVWLNVVDLPTTLLYPLEVRDWLIEDLEMGFRPEVRFADIKLSERRQTL